MFLNRFYYTLIIWYFFGSSLCDESCCQDNEDYTWNFIFNEEKDIEETSDCDTYDPEPEWNLQFENITIDMKALSTNDPTYLNSGRACDTDLNFPVNKPHSQSENVHVSLEIKSLDDTNAHSENPLLTNHNHHTKVLMKNLTSSINPEDLKNVVEITVRHFPGKQNSGRPIIKLRSLSRPATSRPTTNNVFNTPDDDSENTPEGTQIILNIKFKDLLNIIKSSLQRPAEQEPEEPEEPHGDGLNKRLLINIKSMSNAGSLPRNFNDENKIPKNVQTVQEQVPRNVTLNLRFKDHLFALKKNLSSQPENTNANNSGDNMPDHHLSDPVIILQSSSGNRQPKKLEFEPPVSYPIHTNNKQKNITLNLRYKDHLKALRGQGVAHNQDSPKSPTHHSDNIIPQQMTKEVTLNIRFQELLRALKGSSKIPTNVFLEHPIETSTSSVNVDSPRYPHQRKPAIKIKSSSDNELDRNPGSHSGPTTNSNKFNILDEDDNTPNSKYDEMSPNLILPQDDTFTDPRATNFYPAPNRYDVLNGQTRPDNNQTSTSTSLKNDNISPIENPYTSENSGLHKSETNVSTVPLHENSYPVSHNGNMPTDIQPDYNNPSVKYTPVVPQVPSMPDLANTNNRNKSTGKTDTGNGPSSDEYLPVPELPVIPNVDSSLFDVQPDEPTWYNYDYNNPSENSRNAKYLARRPPTNNARPRLNSPVDDNSNPMLLTPDAHWTNGPITGSNDATNSPVSENSKKPIDNTLTSNIPSDFDYLPIPELPNIPNLDDSFDLQPNGFPSYNYYDTPRINWDGAPHLRQQPQTNGPINPISQNSKDPSRNTQTYKNPPDNDFVPILNTYGIPNGNRLHHQILEPGTRGVNGPITGRNNVNNNPSSSNSNKPMDDTKTGNSPSNFDYLPIPELPNVPSLDDSFDVQPNRYPSYNDYNTPPENWNGPPHLGQQPPQTNIPSLDDSFDVQPNRFPSYNDYNTPTRNWNGAPHSRQQPQTNSHIPGPDSPTDTNINPVPQNSKHPNGKIQTYNNPTSSDIIPVPKTPTIPGFTDSNTAPPYNSYGPPNGGRPHHLNLKPDTHWRRGPVTDGNNANSHKPMDNTGTGNSPSNFDYLLIPELPNIPSLDDSFDVQPNGVPPYNNYDTPRVNWNGALHIEQQPQTNGGMPRHDSPTDININPVPQNSKHRNGKTLSHNNHPNSDFTPVSKTPSIPDFSDSNATPLYNSNGLPNGDRLHHPNLNPDTHWRRGPVTGGNIANNNPSIPNSNKPMDNTKTGNSPLNFDYSPIPELPNISSIDDSFDVQPNGFPSYNDYNTPPENWNGPPHLGQQPPQTNFPSLDDSFDVQPNRFPSYDDYNTPTRNWDGAPHLGQHPETNGRIPELNRPTDVNTNPVSQNSKHPNGNTQTHNMPVPLNPKSQVPAPNPPSVPVPPNHVHPQINSAIPRSGHDFPTENRDTVPNLHDNNTLNVKNLTVPDPPSIPDLKSQNPMEGTSFKNPNTQKNLDPGPTETSPTKELKITLTVKHKQPDAKSEKPANTKPKSSDTPRSKSPSIPKSTDMSVTEKSTTRKKCPKCQVNRDVNGKEGDIYWRDFEGHVPEDAIIGGHYLNNLGRRTPIYLAHAFIPSKSYIAVQPAQFFAGSTYLTATYKGALHNGDKNIQILCGDQNAIAWVRQDYARPLNPDVDIVRAGFERNYNLTFGRTMEGNRRIIGKAVFRKEMSYLHQGREKTKLTYDVLCFRKSLIEKNIKILLHNQLD